VDSLTVYYDVHCALCRRCRAWLEAQPTHVPLRFVEADATEAARLLPQLPWLGEELVVVADGGPDHGGAWIGPAGFIVCLWATVGYREWAWRLSRPILAPTAESFFHLVSTNRDRIGRRLDPPACTGDRCVHRLDPVLHPALHPPNPAGAAT
jgi:predicted DCC family thiol-disulfide oxidoreductase YuxK